MLEVACGTGQWTQHLAGRFADVTALDTSADALAIADSGCPRGSGGSRRTCSGSAPRRRSTWSSPASGCRTCRGASGRGSGPGWLALLAPGGVVVCVDETADGLAGKETWSAEAEDVVTRSVADGRTFQVAKLRLDPVAVAARLGDLGWAVEPVTLSADLFALRAQSDRTKRPLAQLRPVGRRPSWRPPRATAPPTSLMSRPTAVPRGADGEASPARCRGPRAIEIVNPAHVGRPVELTRTRLSNVGRSATVRDGASFRAPAVSRGPTRLRRRTARHRPDPDTGSGRRCTRASAGQPGRRAAAAADTSRRDSSVGM